MTDMLTSQSSEEIQRLGEYLAQWKLGNLHGPSTDIGLERGLNALWTNGGLQYAPPIR